ncbi:MAG: DUF1801 domain-containing protein [Oscillospiraceae bacterium]|jgi:uncharacterized protein YdhG (YjbR/CyaY superfamily)|nr:DUF1801 domain-containing protein [Oscillospiraceae bacterium]
MAEQEKRVFSTVDEYIKAQPAEIQPLLLRMRQCILSSVPEAREKISWGMPTFTLRGKNLAHFAAQKRHLGFYPGSDSIAAFAERLGEYNTSKGAVQFPYGSPVSFDLVAEMVRFAAGRLAQ